MTAYLLDTNVLSELMKKNPSTAVLSRVEGLAKNEIFTSAVCFMELRFGAARHPHGSELWQRIENDIQPLVSILPLGYEEAKRAGEILARLEAAGTPIGLEDVLIGSTALVHGITVATRNVKHLSRIEGLSTENWWT
ncbi:MAG: PIN domain-containing protein [Vicinamibacteria bacterium]